MLKINFSNNNRTKKFILKVFGKKVNSEGFVIESETGESVLSSDKQPFSLKEFGGIKNGSEVYVKNDIVSLAGFYRKYLADKS